jgi:hypothetical protein
MHNFCRKKYWISDTAIPLLLFNLSCKKQPQLQNEHTQLASRVTECAPSAHIQDQKRKAWTGNAEHQSKKDSMHAGHVKKNQDC